MADMNHFNIIPVEVIETIFYNLSMKEIKTLGKASKIYIIFVQIKDFLKELISIM